jgi:glucose-6-phosphate 1-dehydrogenase
MRTKAQYEDDVRRTLTSFVTKSPDEAVHIQQFATHFTYFSLDIADSSRFSQLASYANECDEQYRTAGNRMYYLALAPELFERVTAQIVQSGLRASVGWQRLIIEKPFGYDLASATALQRHVRDAFAEHEIFRIDHYLGKTMVRTLYDLRFHNIFLAPLWNRQGIAHVQITLSESLGVEERGSYYESSGALRDMVQNHMLQLIAFLAMRRPTATTPTALRQATTDVLRALIPYADEEDVPATILKNRNQDEYVIKNLLQKRQRGNRTEYLVRWKGYPIEDATWEYRSKIPKSFVEIYEEENQ